MSSDRPETSEPQWSSEPGADPPAPAAISTSYIPHVFDLITPTHRARDTAKLHIPPAFLQSEAVDSSLPLGHGASFSVTRQSLPPGPSQSAERLDMGSYTVERVVAATPRPRYVVYKSARVAFKDNGQPATPADRRALQSVLTEFHALLHPPLLAHPNIIDFLGLAWGSNPVDPKQRLPVLVVEYGDRGTLADVQLGSRAPLPDGVKAEICLGIARGLQILHKSDIAHGDVKPENIIMCSGPDGKLVPKLADFGFAVIDTGDTPDVTIGGTRTWRAPESFGPIPVASLHLTDVYSFGLVAWSIALDGTDPFTLLLPENVSASARLLEIDKMKAEDKVVQESTLQAWLIKWLVFNHSKRTTGQQSEEASGCVQEASQSAADAATQSIVLSKALLAQLASSPNIVKKMAELLRRREYFKHIENILSSTLSREPESRSLDSVITLLEAGAAIIPSKVSSLTIADNNAVPSAAKPIEVEKDQASTSSIAHPNDGKTRFTVTNNSEETRTYKKIPIKAHPAAVSGSWRDHVKIDWSALGFKSLRISWQITRDLDPLIQNFAVKTVPHLTNGYSRFVLCAFAMNGYGIPSDTDQALKYLVEAAHKGHGISQAYLYRMFMACEREVPADVPFLDYLKQQALNGSRMALQDLRTLNPQVGKERRELIKYGYGGVAAKWFNEDQLHYGLSQPKLMSKEFDVESLIFHGKLQDLVVNVKGDRLIHAAAAIGAFTLVQKLIDNLKIDVNQRNSKGETALLCACRSGHPDIVKLLLDSGAVASISSLDGETPLHWLIAFDENINPAALGNDLIGRGGADVNAFTTKRISYSVFPASIDVDFQMEGTPLMWAVHDNKPKVVSYLLSKGSNPNWRYATDSETPLGWAAFFHYPECLKLMVEHLERTEDLPVTTDGKRDLRHAVVYGPLVVKAIRASDKFSMIIRNGKDYLERLRETLKYLHDKTALINFRVGGGDTLLHLAAASAHDEACQVLLDLKWRIDEINKPAGEAGRTALLESVRWNRPGLFRLLCDHGADANALAINPYNAEDRSWSALHVFAEQAHDEHLDLLDTLVASGVPVDGPPDSLIETPLHVAMQQNAFNLADRLLKHGASLNAARPRSSLIISPHPLTGLGHAIALNARYSFSGLRYMLSTHESGHQTGVTSDFTVEPARELSALHLVAIVPEGLTYVGSKTAVAREDFDWDTNRAIAHELLDTFREPAQLDRRCKIQGKTALHLAAEHGNVGVVEELVKLGADRSLRSESGETAAEIARRVFSGQAMLEKLVAWLE